ncbi:MAG TPA: 4-alpha-glucanotransferase, partial [Chthoniobacterales bacterium]|nr:4-alpha-glucanotransferase [Chthoniobacterales bacterium]
ITLRIPAQLTGGSIKLEIQWENGDLEHHWFWLPELRELERAVLDGREFVTKRVPLPAPLKLGYHQVKLYWVKEPEQTAFADARFIVCPRRAHALEGRIAGVAVSLYGLRSARNWGCGDFTDLRGAIDAFAPAGAAFIALNPLHAIANRQPYNTSPYLPQSTLFRNFLYLDVERVPGYVHEDARQHEIETLRATEFVEYEGVAGLKLRALRDAFARFLASGHTGAFEQFVQSEGAALHDYAVYCALDERVHCEHPEIWLWTDWPEQYRDPRSPAVAEFAQRNHAAVSLYKFLQWQIDCQLAEAQAHAIARGMSIGLYHDLALATDRFGADLWMDRPFYSTSAKVGAPPDELAPGGQDWGFPPPNREAHRRDGYRRFVQSIRNNARHGGALRIDHVMRFFRLFWIPDGLSAAHGTYVRDYVDHLLGILALESVRGNFIVIGEDLGTVQGEVRQRLSEAAILGYRLLWFERNPDGSFRLPYEYPERAAVSTTTHDLPTLAGFTAGRDIEARRVANLIDQNDYDAQWTARRDEVRRLEEALRAAGFPGDALGFAMATPCVLAIVNQEDLTGETEQQNLPASTWQHPNWRRKMKVAVEDFGTIAEELRNHIERSSR